jgi:hypothetical protein
MSWKAKDSSRKVYHLGVRQSYSLIKEMEAEECVGISGILTMSQSRTSTLCQEFKIYLIKFMELGFSQKLIYDPVIIKSRSNQKMYQRLHLSQGMVIMNT